METLDFRSDTVTKPTPEMWEAMANAPVGDDVYGEDPSVNRLQEMAAELVGMEAGLLVPSGTMGNLAAMLAHCGRGDEVILGHLAHAFLFEAGGVSALGGIHSHQVRNQPDGTMALEDIREAVRGEDEHCPVTRLVTIENTHNRCGGVSLSVDYTRAVSELAQEFGLKFHIDGARIFNAAVDQGVKVKELTSPADSVTFCLSKGLAAPVGSVLCGSKDLIYRAHRARKMLGGGMRQAGVIAAAGIVALEKMVDRMAEDHRRAKALAEGLSQIEGITVESCNTNMVYFFLDESVPLAVEAFLEQIMGQGLLVDWVHGRRFRMVAHVWIDDEAVARALDILGAVVGGA